MPITINCPICGGKVYAPEKAAGRRLRCPKCGVAVETETTKPTSAQTKKSGITPVLFAAAYTVLALGAVTGGLWASGLFKPAPVAARSPVAQADAAAPQAPPRTKRSVADLVNALKSKNFEDRRNAIQALEALGPDAEPAVAPLIEALGDPEYEIDAAEALGRIGPTAQKAIPALYRAFSKDPKKQGMLLQALKRIEPKAAELYEAIRDQELKVEALKAKARAKEARSRTFPGDTKLITEAYDAAMEASNAEEELLRLQKAFLSGEYDYRAPPPNGKAAPRSKSDTTQPTSRPRTSLRTELEARKGETLSSLEQKYETNKDVIQRLRVQEDALVQSPGFGGIPADGGLLFTKKRLDQILEFRKQYPTPPVCGRPPRRSPGVQLDPHPPRLPGDLLRPRSPRRGRGQLRRLGIPRQDREEPTGPSVRLQDERLLDGPQNPRPVGQRLARASTV